GAHRGRLAAGHDGCAVILDAHGHVGGWADFLSPDPTASGLVASMDRLGVTAVGVSALLAVGPDAIAGNDLALAAAAEHPGRIGVWLVANPYGGWDRLADGLGHDRVWGLKLHPDAHEHPLDGPGYTRAFALAAEHGVPVLAHSQTGSPWSDPARFAEVGRRHPDVP